MRLLLLFSRTVDGLVDRLGRLTGWLTLAMVLVGAYNTIVRYLGRYVGWNLSSNAYLELQWYLFSLIFLLGGAYALQKNVHVRVDVVYGRFSPKVKAWVDLVGSCLLLLPFCCFALYVSWPSIVNSWTVREISPDPDGLLRYPIKTMILVAFGLLILQGLSIIVRQIAFLRGIDLEPKTALADGQVAESATEEEDR